MAFYLPRFSVWHMIEEILFLVADTRLYKLPYWSVGRSVGLSLFLPTHPRLRGVYMALLFVE